MNTLAELKRVAKQYTWEVTYNSIHNAGAPEQITPWSQGLRTIDRFQSQSICFRMADGSRSWTQYQSAKEFSFAEIDGELIVTVTPDPKNFPQSQPIQQGQGTACVKYRLTPIQQGA